MSKRTIALVLAVALAALATVALYSFVQGAEDRAFEGVETVDVFRAKEEIPAGTTGESAQSQGLIERVKIPKVVRAEGGIAALDYLRGKIAAVDIVKGEQILERRFVAPSEVTGRLPIPARREAVSLEVGIPPGVAGFIKPGDRISIVAQLQVERGGEQEERVQYLLQNVQVLAIGQRTVASEVAAQPGEAEAAPQGRVLATVALSPGQIERLVFAILNGQIYFTLLPRGAQAADTPGVTARNAFR